MASARTAVIAIVDDEASVRKALSRLFRSSGYDTREFASGPDFLKTLPYCRYDCLVLDLHMPKMSGLDVQLDDAFLGASIPTVIITAHDEPDTRRKSLAAGAHGYICKPFDDNELLNVIGEAMKSWRGQLDTE
jgi:FixJ family two-component response regulator